MKNSPIGADWVGQIVDGKFTLLEWLGGSAGSGVFRTELREGPRAQNVAIKIIDSEGMEAESHLAGWAATVRLSHPHLMPVFRFGQCQIGLGSQVYVVTEYADEVLSQLLPERPMASEEALEMLGPILDALEYLHRNGFVHAHLKPSNIQVVSDRLKLSGDGLHQAGKYRKSPSTLTVYDAPELAFASVSPAADLWSLGVSLVEALTQHTPIVDTATSEEPVIPDSIPEPFAEIVRHCLRRKPSLRWRVEDIKAHLDPTGSRAVFSEETPMSGPQKTRFAVAAVLGLVVAAAITVFFLHPHTTQPPIPAPAESSAPVADSAASQSPTSAGSTPASPQRPAAGKNNAPAAASAAPPAPIPVHSNTPAPVTPASPAESKGLQGAVVKGEVAQRTMPDVPPRAMETIQGKFELTVRVNVDARGGVTDASLESPGPSKYFANFALEASRNWKFTPAQSGGQSVASVWTLRYQFRRTGTEATAVEVSP